MPKHPTYLKRLIKRYKTNPNDKEDPALRKQSHSYCVQRLRAEPVVANEPAWTRFAKYNEAGGEEIVKYANATTQEMRDQPPSPHGEDGKLEDSKTVLMVHKRVLKLMEFTTLFSTNISSTRTGTITPPQKNHLATHGMYSSGSPRTHLKN